MTELILRRTVKNWENTADPEVRERYGVVAGAVGIFTNLLLFGMKGLVGLMFGSVAILADAVNNLSDAGSSIITLLGFKLSSKPADAEHPYGHARMEYICGMVVSLLIISLGLQLMGSSVEKIVHPQLVEAGALTYLVLAVSILLKLWQGMFYRTVGRRISSTALQATAADSLSDVISTSAVLLSAGVSALTGLRLDGWMGLAVAVFVIVSGVKLVVETANPLLGTAPAPQLVQAIEEKILSYDGVIGVHDLMVHSYGPDRIFASAHAEVPANQDILISHDVIDNIEHDFLEQMNLRMVIHLDPVITDNEQLNQLRAMVGRLVGEVSPVLSMHDFRAVFGATHTNLIFDVAAPPGFPMGDQELCQRISRLVRQVDDSYYTVITVDRNYVSSTTRQGDSRDVL